MPERRAVARLPKRASLLAAFLLLALGLWQLGEGLAIHAKALVAQVLLRQAWATSLNNPDPVRLWPWADSHPVARIKIPALGLDQIVLADPSGRTLAFGPGHLTGTALPGEEGNAILGGHRDTHFAGLGKLERGATITVQRRDGSWRHYRVTGHTIIDHRDAVIEIPPSDTTNGAHLTLVTCYPFENWQPGGPLRYLLFAEGMGVTTSPPPLEPK